MAETKTMEREYIIPLRKEWTKVPRYKRTYKSVKAIKEFIAKHMRVEDRDTKKVKLDVFLNNEMWFRGSKKPPAKVKVKATKVGDIVRVEMVDTPESVKFLKQKLERRNKKGEVKAEPKSDKAEKAPAAETPASEEEKKETVEEKKKSEEALHEKLAKQETKTMKHTAGVKKEPQIHRKALKK